MSGGYLDPPPQVPPCLECGSSDEVEPTGPYLIRDKTIRWWAACCNLPMAGTATENATHQARKIAAAAERGELDHSHDAGRRAGVIPDPRQVPAGAHQNKEQK